MKKFLLLLFFVSSNICLAQTSVWKKKYFNINVLGFFNATALKNGNYIVSGMPKSCNMSSVVSLDNQGEIIAQHVFNTTSFIQIGNGIELTNSDLLFCGYYDNQLMLFRMDTSFNIIWAYQYPNLGVIITSSTMYQRWNIPSIKTIQCTDGNFICVSYDSYTKNIIALKFDASGNKKWLKNYDLNPLDSNSSVIPTPDGGAIINGGWTNQGTTTLRIDSIGNTLWAKNYTVNNTKIGIYDLIALNNNEFIACGKFINPSSNFNSGIVFKIDSLGNPLWAKSATIPPIQHSNFVFSKLIHESNNTIKAYGFTLWYSGQGMPPLEFEFLIGFDDSGNQILSKKISGSDFCSTYDIIRSNDNNYLFVGNYLFNTGTIWEPFVQKIDKDLYNTCGIIDSSLTINAVTVSDSTINPVTVNQSINHVPLTLSITTNPATLTTLCSSVSIQETNNPPTTSITLSPNPTTDNITISLPQNSSTPATLTLTDALGRLINTYPLASGTQTTTLNISSLATGMYFLHYLSGSTTQVLKVMKE